MGLNAPNDTVIISEATIAQAVNMSGQALPFDDGKKIGVGVELTLEIGKTFQPRLLISGDFKRDPDTQEVIGWGSAFKIYDLLEMLCPEYLNTLKNDYQIADEAIQAMVGKKILRLCYVSGRKPEGKLKYSDWTTVGDPAKGIDVLRKRFEQSVSRGFPGNYHPEA